VLCHVLLHTGKKLSNFLLYVESGQGHMESATKLQRYVKAVDAGVDQFGGVDEPEYLIQAVRQGLLTEARLNESAYRVLLQKFQQGLFEHPFVDVAKAREVVGNAAFRAAALDAQRRAMVLLKNDAHALPLQATGRRVWLYKIDPEVAKRYGFTVVDTPKAADIAILRVSTPYTTLHPNYRFGRTMHEGTLAFEDGNPDYEAIKAATAAPKSIVSVYMDRPAILAKVQGKAAAILANFGATDIALFDVLTGRGKPEGKLPYELPSSMEEVLAKRSDRPQDTAHPLYPFGYGLSY
ncbi:glycoside hydrolase family 3 C-terminal domain-containing protein, partial [Burkholderia ubonensis]|uniref:glycoside hydrolase family 3 C-terminal domain-containing protein n=1 Tax=Burkholderia ubonensis TaxID=101571 RepID=UPI000AE4BCE2